MSVDIRVGDSLEVLRTLPDGIAQTCVTSPPYWGLRDYQVDGQIGLEDTPDAFIARLVEVFDEVRRVLRDDGTAWVNMGDSYAGSDKGISFSQGVKATNILRVSKGSEETKGRHHGLPSVAGIPPKNLIGQPWRLAFALQAAGWYLRSDIIWKKPNPMPESVTDRPTKSHEYIFLLSKKARYFYDADAVKTVSKTGTDLGLLRGRTFTDGERIAHHAKSIQDRQSAGVDSRTAASGYKNARTVWTIPSHAYPDAHFATFPPALPTRCIKAGSRRGDLVLDPFSGAGTTGLAAQRLGRRYLGIELNPEYAEMSRKRLERDRLKGAYVDEAARPHLPLFGEGAP